MNDCVSHIQLVGKYSPMRRGLRLFLHSWRLRLRRSWKVFPDEEGIETFALLQVMVRSPGWKVFPDEEGIETQRIFQRC